MKKKLDPEEKTHRQAWRDIRYAMPSIPRAHHFTKKERIAIAEAKKEKKPDA